MKIGTGAGAAGMTTNAELAARLLRNAAKFFRDIGANTPQITEQMEQNARTYETVAQWTDDDPLGEAPISVDEDD